MTNNEVKARIAKGAAWLDKWHPGWAMKIDLRSLNMFNCLQCVAGQLFGDYRDLPFQPHWPRGMSGMDMGLTLSVTAYALSSRNFQKLWVAEIKARRRTK